MEIIGIDDPRYESRYGCDNWHPIVGLRAWEPGKPLRGSITLEVAMPFTDSDKKRIRDAILPEVLISFNPFHKTLMLVSLQFVCNTTRSDVERTMKNLQHKLKQII